MNFTLWHIISTLVAALAIITLYYFFLWLPLAWLVFSLFHFDMSLGYVVAVVPTALLPMPNPLVERK